MPDEENREFDETTIEIARLNDELRTTFNSAAGQVVATADFHALPQEDKTIFLGLVRTFTKFSEDNDPYGQHDFGKVSIGEQDVFWKIDLYDETMQFASPDPTDTQATKRVLTVMLANDY